MKRKALLFHRFIYKMVSFVMKVYLQKYSFRTEKVPKLDENYLFISNHTTNYDFVIAGNASPETMYFVCEEALMKIPALGTLLKVVADPIPITTGQPSLIDIRNIMNRLHDGKNVCLFPEGRHSYHGVTMKQENSIGKMVRLSGAALVTYRIRGGFFTKPRWSRNARYGPIWGEVKGIYSSEQLRTMSNEEITDIINRDIYEDAYNTQLKMHYRYTGKDKAEGMEKYTFFCPRCFKQDTIRSQGDSFWCEACDLKGEYNDEGFLTGSNLPFDNIRDWAAFT